MHRRFDICSIGNYESDNYKGRANEKLVIKWSAKCNFVFKVIATVTNMDEDKKNSGWLLEVTRNERDIYKLYISCSMATTVSYLRRAFMNEIPGTVCLLSPDAFFRFVDEDCTGESLKYFAVTRCGYYEIPRPCDTSQLQKIWVFPTVNMDAFGRPLLEANIILDKSARLTHLTLPEPAVYVKSAPRLLRELGKKLASYYGPRNMHAVHVLATAARAVHRSAVMKSENQFAVTNLSGPVNIGKTFACAISLRMLGSDGLILSKCTPASMSNIVDAFNDMMVVWDDPRDTNRSQITSIIHEAFHGYASSCVSRGVRRYNSTLLIGTQSALLGFPYCSESMPSYSRLIHIDMDIDTKFRATLDDEHMLKKEMDGVNVFGFILNHFKYERDVVDKVHRKMQKVCPGVVDRALRILAVDYCFTSQMSHLLGICKEDLDSYFFDSQLSFLNKYCTIKSPFVEFLQDICILFKKHKKIPYRVLKSKVMVDLKHAGPHACVAIHCKEFFPMVLEPKSSNDKYTQEMIYSIIRDSKGKYGEVGRNVSYSRVDNDGVKVTHIFRSLVIRHDIIRTTVPDLMSYLV